MDNYYSKQIRKKIKHSIEEVGDFLNYFGIDNSLKYELFIESLKCNDDSKIINSLTQFGLISEQKQRETDIFKRTVYIQGYTDFYIMSRLHNKIQKNDQCFININYEMIENFFNDADLYTVILKSMEEFTELSAYNKIILFKLLTKEEKEMLKKINPFFEFEKNKFDIKITKEIVLNQMDKWNNSLGLEKAIEETTNFIFSLYDLDSSNINELLNITGESIEPDEAYIKCNNTYIVREHINEYLKKEYNSKQKIKK